MKVSEALKSMMKQKKMTQSEVAEQMGKNQNSVAMYLKNADSMRLDNLMRMVDVCGYDVVLVDRNGDGESYVLGDGSEIHGTMLPQKMTDGMREVVRGIVREEIANAMAK